MSTSGAPKTRVLLAKVGLDGHDRGIRIVARFLMEAGMEVIYTGLRSTPEEVLAAALDEDIDVVGLSFLAGDHMALAPKVIEGLRREGMGDALVLLGGIIPKKDIPALRQMGVGEVFLPGTRPERIAQFIRDRLTHNQAQERDK
ncbi:MAG: cobalamin B12-binding domain-containing protein [Betaproteobacteria bacterium]|nr:cobalamin B12-binding domain-containing protein [Betaproteobacteria bacterium]MBI2959661.1 cobalamin B12-binding domain-containing protein [Betaproteobacteria bacterium]